VSDEFLRLAKSYFIRLQAANDKKDTDDLRRFLTPEMFAEAQLQIAERGSTTQTTDILELNAVVTSLVTQGALDIGSVRFTGQIQCSDALAPESFSEVWHFSKVAGVGNEWSLAGIQQD
jgi:predicted lipid-binding transport protein (Tim44 family)